MAAVQLRPRDKSRASDLQKRKASLAQWSTIGLIALFWVAGDYWDHTHAVTGYLAAIIFFGRIFLGALRAKLLSWCSRSTEQTHRPALMVFLVFALSVFLALVFSGRLFDWDLSPASPWVDHAYSLTGEILLVILAFQAAGIVMICWQSVHARLKAGFMPDKPTVRINSSA